MTTVIHWSDSLERVVKEEAERCAALAWAHERSQRWCANWNTRLMFPSVILATFTGAGAVGADSMFPFEGNTTLIGILTLCVGTLQTIQNYFAFAKRSGEHRIASLAYGKMHTHLSMQLSLPRSERKPAADVIEKIQGEMERLSEIVPLIPSAVKEQFTKKFKDLENYAIPSVLNGLESVRVADVETPVAVVTDDRPRVTFTIDSGVSTSGTAAAAAAARNARLHRGVPSTPTPRTSTPTSGPSASSVEI